jgi:prepilin signal peptidase PulO-like enzyme (type II secretory pathway)
MNNNENNTIDAEKSLINSLKTATVTDEDYADKVGTARTMMVAPSVLSIIIGVIFLFVSRSYSSNDESGLGHFMLVLMTGAIFAFSLLITVVCLIAGLAILRKVNKK